MNKIYVLYHSNCNDGSGAKFAAWSKFGDAATYIPVQYKNPMPEIEDGSDVYIVDFSYPRGELESLAARVNKLVVLDHHKTASEDLKGFPGAVFDMSKSGAVLAWEYFHPDKEVPELLLRVQDRDLWNWKYSDTGAITSISMLARDNPEEWLKLSAKPFSTLLTEGEAIMRYKQNETEFLASKASMGYYFDEEDENLRGSFSFVNATSLQSEVCNQLLTEWSDIYFAVAFVTTTSGWVLVSLRSRKGGFDVSKLAKKFGGGGHQSSAGCTMSPTQWLEFVGQKTPSKMATFKKWASRYAESFLKTVKDFLPWSV